MENSLILHFAGVEALIHYTKQKRQAIVGVGQYSIVTPRTHGTASSNERDGNSWKHCIIGAG